MSQSLMVAKMAKGSAKTKPAKKSTSTVKGLKENSAALKSHEKALKAHTAALKAHAAVMTAHAIALTPAAATGACSIIFTDGRAPMCVDGLTNSQCQQRAAHERGTAWPIVPGQKCFTG
jgi:hypothetical protein